MEIRKTLKNIGLAAIFGIAIGVPVLTCTNVGTYAVVKHLDEETRPSCYEVQQRLQGCTEDLDCDLKSMLGFRKASNEYLKTYCNSSD